jgi:hypothetical protein
MPIFNYQISYMLTNLKQDLINKISATNDENLLLLLKTNYEYFSQKGVDVTDELSENDKAELISMVNEPFGSDTVSQKELDEAIKQWRTK